LKALQNKGLEAESTEKRKVNLRHRVLRFPADSGRPTDGLLKKSVGFPESAGSLLWILQSLVVGGMVASKAASERKRHAMCREKVFA
jgi:hypothetical protein